MRDLWMAKPFVCGVVVVEVPVDPVQLQLIWADGSALYTTRMRLGVMKFATLHAGV